jgi:hypothetical protein
MSRKKRSDWKDETAQDYLDAEPIEGFADLEDDYADPVEDAAAPAAPAAKAAPAKKSTPAPRTAPRGRGISSHELGFLFSASILVAAAGVGSACLLAVGASPVDLWRPAELMQWNNYLDLGHHPLNVLALIVLGAVVLTLLGSRAIARAAAGANDRFRAAENVLTRLTALRLTDEEGWQKADFSDHAGAATFAAEALGAWRLQAARQKRYMGLEGELHRLEKALADNCRQDLTGRFDNPAVGSLADEMVRYFDERGALSRELAELRERDQADVAAVAALIQEARGWNRAAREQVGAQGVALERAAARAGEAAGGAPHDAASLVAQIRGAVPAGGLPDGFGELVDRGGKIAFQLAMEVSRLGPRGDRLQPMAQALDDLTSEFRKLAEGPAAAGAPAGVGDLLDALETRLAAPAAEAGDGASLDDVAASLAEAAAGFQTQSERLLRIGEQFAALTGSAFDPAGEKTPDPSAPVEAPLAARPDDTFAAAPAPVADELDPFAAPAPPVADATPAAAAPVDDPEPFVIERSGPAQPFGSPEPAAADSTPVDAAPSPAPFTVDNNLSFDDPTPGFDPEPVTDPSLSSPAETVYDLEAFGATPAADDTTGPVHDLSDFGATPVDEPAAEAQEKIYDLAEFGAVRVDEVETEGADRIYDLAEFGAVLVN